ncbi:MAG TPA: hypothetical protein VIF09_29570 [Polyangiaceae bacterium]|jgi:hypothetical protein
MARGAGRIGAAVVVAWIGSALFACADLREDELDCEEAVSVLEHCCSGFPSSNVSCVYESEGCSTVYPDIPLAESKCIRSESCESLVSSGVCARAAARAGEHATSSGDAGDVGAGVCP